MKEKQKVMTWPQFKWLLITTFGICIAFIGIINFTSVGYLLTAITGFILFTIGMSKFFDLYELN